MNVQYAKRQQQLLLLGYWLETGKRPAQLSEVKSILDDICHRYNHRLIDVETESGNPNNPIRIGLWAALRKLVCYKCPVKRMSFSVLNIEDFVDHALEPCICTNPEGLSGIVINGVGHICADPIKGSQLLILLAARGKHVVNEAGMCISCCHPATQALVERRRTLVSHRAS